MYELIGYLGFTRTSESMENKYSGSLTVFEKSSTDLVEDFLSPCEILRWKWEQLIFFEIVLFLVKADYLDVSLRRQRLSTDNVRLGIGIFTFTVLLLKTSPSASFPTIVNALRNILTTATTYQ